MKVLLDTNILIHREASTIISKDIGVLFNWLDKLKYEKCIHPTTLLEIQKHNDSKVVKTMSIKLESYHLLKTEAPLGQEVQAVSDKWDNGINDINDTKILNEVYAGRVDILITEDRKIHFKALLLNIASKVFTISSFLEKVNAENPDLTDYKVLSVKKEYFGNIDINDPFFDSFKEDYIGFEAWFNKKADSVAYICKSEKNEILAFLFIKLEDENENYADVEPKFEPKKRLKIGTFKVVMNGFKLGERFLKIIFDNALANKVDEIYVTIFNKRIEQELLMKFVADWGFKSHGVKKSSSGEEEVFVRPFGGRVNMSYPRLSHPYINRNTNFWIVPIYPAYHTELFPDSILKTESPANFIENEPHRNAISKVYISRSIEKGLKPGDVIIFYRTQDKSRGPAYYTAVVTTIGVVESVIDNIPNEKDFIAHCRKRSVFTDKELAEYWNHTPNWRPFVVNFLYVYSFPIKLTRQKLIDLGILGTDPPRGFYRITKDHFNKILIHAKADESFIID